MARVEIDPALKALYGNIREIHGTLHKSVNGTRLIAKTYKNGKIRMYLMPEAHFKRSTALSKAEQENRQRFAITCRIYKILRAHGDRRSRKEINAEYYHLPLSELARIDAELTEKQAGDSSDIVPV